MTKYGECRLCREDKQLADSHVIPQALHKDFQGEGATDATDATEIYSQDQPHPKRSWTGVYGQFLCQQCEGSFGQYDEYGVDFVRKYRDGQAGEPLNGSLIASDVDYKKLKLWLMSILWRADACDTKMYKNVSLGTKWRNDLTRRIKNDSPGCSDDYAVMASLFRDEEHFGVKNIGQSYMRDPGRVRCSGVNFYKFYIYGGFTFLIKVDQQKPPNERKQFLLREGEPFAIERRAMSDSEINDFRRLAIPHIQAEIDAGRLPKPGQ